MTRARARQGSEAMSHDSANLATPDIKWLGVTARVCRVCVGVLSFVSPTSSGSGCGPARSAAGQLDQRDRFSIRDKHKQLSTRVNNSLLE